jgi:hypothetical protein
MKHCNKCKQTKPVTDFHKDRARSDGFQIHCKICKNAVLKSWRSPNRIKVSEVDICKNMEKLHYLMDGIIRNGLREAA